MIQAITNVRKKEIGEEKAVIQYNVPRTTLKQYLKMKDKSSIIFYCLWNFLEFFVWILWNFFIELQIDSTFCPKQELEYFGRMKFSETNFRF